MVADKVTVISRMAGSSREGVKWESDGQGEFTVDAIEKPSRGTEVILHLKEDAKEFLEPWSLRELVKKYSDFIEHPVVMDVEHKEGDKTERSRETINAQATAWLQEVGVKPGGAFYQRISNDTEKPAPVIHYTGKGKTEFKVLAFIPARKPFSFAYEEPKGLKLYIQRVLIMDSCEGLLPPYLRFVRGVVDSADLPLNISRELLQQNPLLDRMQKNIVRNVLEALEAMKNTDYEKYVPFFEDLGVMLKEGAARDWSNRERVSDLLLFQSTRTEPGKYTTLADYVGRMPTEQKDIFYLIGESREMIDSSPLLEAYKSKGWEVLLLTDPMDEFLFPSLRDYKGKGFKPVDRADTEAPVEDPPADTGRFRDFLSNCSSRSCRR